MFVFILIITGLSTIFFPIAFYQQHKSREFYFGQTRFETPCISRRTSCSQFLYFEVVINELSAVRHWLKTINKEKIFKSGEVYKTKTDIQIPMYTTNYSVGIQDYVRATGEMLKSNDNFFVVKIEQPQTTRWQELPGFPFTNMYKITLLLNNKSYKIFLSSHINRADFNNLFERVT